VSVKVFAAVFSLFFLIRPYPNFGGRGAHGSTMIPFGRDLVSSHRLSIQTTLVSGTVWPQFAIQVLTGCQPPIWGNGWSYGVADASAE